MATITVTKGLIGVEDISFMTGGATTGETFNRATSTGGSQAIHKLSAKAVPVEDASSRWTGTDVETVLAEVTDKILYGTIWVPAGALMPTATNGAAVGIKEHATNDIMTEYLAFDDATEQYAAFNIVMPEAWDRSTIKAKFYWSSATGSTAGDTVEWELAGIALSDSDAIDTAVGTSQVITDTLLADNGTDLQVTAATPAITVGGTPALNDMVHYKVSRNVGGTDDMTEDAWLFGILIQYKVTQNVTGW